MLRLPSNDDAPPMGQACGPAMPSLARGQLHEIHAGLQDWAAALGFALNGLGKHGLGTNVVGGRGMVLLRTQRGATKGMRLYGEGLLALGIDPAQLLIIEAGDEREVLRAGLEAARCEGLGAVVLETWGAMPSYDLTASRRLVLAGERSGVGIAVLRGDAAPRASAAHTRWAISAAASSPLSGRGPLSARPAHPVFMRQPELARHPARAPGPPSLEARLERQRGGQAGRSWRLEWDGEYGNFRARAAPLTPATLPDPTSTPGAVAAVFGLRAGAAG